MSRAPVLCEADFVCTCGHRLRVAVLGRKGHRYDELEGIDENEPDKFIKESYAAEGQGVLDLYACPKCGTRPGLKRELRRLGLYFLTLVVMTGAVSGMLYGFSDRMAAFGVLLAGSIAILGKSYAFLAALLEAKDRVREVTALRSAKDEGASSASGS